MKPCRASRARIATFIWKYSISKSSRSQRACVQLLNGSRITRRRRFACFYLTKLQRGSLIKIGFTWRLYFEQWNQLNVLCPHAIASDQSWEMSSKKKKKKSSMFYLNPQPDPKHMTTLDEMIREEEKRAEGHFCAPHNLNKPCVKRRGRRLNVRG
jgi:hypothetical protein